jgi:GR25 family glycosyltransferase involved in LPS biosynthesis
MKLLFWILCLFIILFISLVIGFRNSIETFDNKRTSINKHIDVIYYINLDKRNDRKNEFLDNFNQADETRIVRVPAHYYPENGAVGCLMSHITALNRALDDDVGENILICEDDFTIKDMDYCNQMLELLFDKIPDWDVIMLGQNTIKSTDTEFKTPKDEKIVRILDSQTASGYLIKKNYIPRLLEIYENDMANYVRTGKWGNYYVDQSWKVLQPKDKWYSTSPSIGVQRKSYSDIQKGYIQVEV